MTRTGHYLIGIDLGTSHTVLAYSERGAPSPGIEFLALPQLISPGNVAARRLLPSLRYHPGQGEFDPADLQLPWPHAFPADPVPQAILGELARSLGARTPGRLVASAKSWLCHPQADRTARILPWGASDEVARVSPVEASASYLAHVRAAWNQRFPQHLLESQTVVLTVPASFDEAARALTLEAARLAGLGPVQLLEEPQAACYDFLWRRRRQLRAAFEQTRLLLICDLGGGTSDFTLIRVEPGEKLPTLTRIGVGDHLLLGGDNMDHALARHVESLLAGDGKRLSAGEFSQLAAQCRGAKEKLLAQDAPESAPVTLLGGGGRLVGGTRSATLSREDVQRLVLDGFFPLVPADAQPDRRRGALVEFGLPYAPDPAITRHLAAFLARHGAVCREAVGTDGTAMPDTMLCNGGVFRSPQVARRLLEQLTAWRGAEPALLPNERPDLAVAAGAVAYAMAQEGRLLRIGGGSPRSYFLAVEEGKGQSAVCVLPRGAEPGEEHVLTERSFALRLGRPVQFALLSTTDDTAYATGQTATIDEERFLRLPPLALALEPTASGTQEIPVQLAARLTELGCLQVDCLDRDDPARRWHLEFRLRGATPPPSTETDAHPHLSEALDCIAAVYGPRRPEVRTDAVKTLRADLERLLGSRADWSTPLLRALFDALLAHARNRRRSPQHERLWCSLAGWCLRPGFGAPLDEWRVDQLWPLYEAGIQYQHEVQNWSEWWNLWRRAAGGLDEARQQHIQADLAGFLDPDRARRSPYAGWLPKRSFEGMVRLAGALERIPADSKDQLGGWLLARLEKSPESAELAWAIGRLGARAPWHGSVHNVLTAERAADWLQSLLELDWKKHPAIGFAAGLICRFTGDRARDLEEGLRRRVAEALRAARAPESWQRMVLEVVELSEADEKRLYGEALPPGLKLIG